jgi:hypothetical protein
VLAQCSCEDECAGFAIYQLKPREEGEGHLTEEFFRKIPIFLS